MGTRFEDLHRANLTTVGIKINLEDIIIGEEGEYDAVVAYMLEFVEQLGEYFQTYVPEKVYISNETKLRPATGTKYSFLHSTSGLHVDGKSEKPHLHINCILADAPIPEKFKRDNRSKKFAKDKGIPFPKCSIKFETTVEGENWHYLAYPLKEDKIVCRNQFKNLDDSDVEFLLVFARNLWEQTVAQRAYDEKAKLKVKTQLNNLLELCENNRDKFKNLKSMMKWYFTHLKKLRNDGTIEINDLPNPVKIYSELEKVAFWIGIWDMEDGYHRLPREVEI